MDRVGDPLIGKKDAISAEYLFDTTKGRKSPTGNRRNTVQGYTQTTGRKARYELNSGKWNGHPVMMAGENANSNMNMQNSQETPYWLTSNAPRAAPGIPSVPGLPRMPKEMKVELKGSERITSKATEILRCRKKLYDLRSVWKGYVKVADGLITRPTKELKAQNQDIERAIAKEPMMFEEETWVGMGNTSASNGMGRLKNARRDRKKKETEASKCGKAQKGGGSAECRRTSGLESRKGRTRARIHARSACV